MNYLKDKMAVPFTNWVSINKDIVNDINIYNPNCNCCHEPYAKPDSRRFDI